MTPPLNSAAMAARAPRLLEAVLSVGTGLELPATLDRICETAAWLTGARYAALGVIDKERGGLAEFVTYGVPPAEAERIGRRPDGRSGLLGALIKDPGPILLDDLTVDPRATGLPAGHPPMRTFLGVPVQVEGEVFGNLYLSGKDGDPSFTRDDLKLVQILAGQAGVAIGNARLYEAAAQRERWIDGSVAVTTALLSGEDADDSLSVVAEQARRLAEADAGIVALFAEDGGLEVVAVATPGEAPRGLLGAVVPPETPAAARLFAGEAQFFDDAARETQTLVEIAAHFGPTMMLPLKSDGHVLGALVTPRRRGGRPFSAAERVLAGQFASQAALALIMAQAQRDRERLAVYEDRDRIARDLHDLVVQRLFATGMMLEGAQRKSHVPEVRDRVGKAVDELDLTIQEIRTTIFALQQGPADAPSSLRTRVLREINMASVPLGFKPGSRFIGPVDAAVGELTTKNLVAALREALSNAFRHAQATRIDVVVDATAVLADGQRGVRLTVADDGVGIPEGGRRSGLRNLRRRAEALGGTSEFGAGLGGSGTRPGTTVTWEAPLGGA
ncbi:GAF domain-containing protein [Streptomyces sp. NPDC060194]|uniref:sensor histidine kinase n=1 Tax=Streptomyces sp. NPDC060194 TaxID=3347069 RepID=UPI00364E9491